MTMPSSDSSGGFVVDNLAYSMNEPDKSANDHVTILLETVSVAMAAIFA